MEQNNFDSNMNQQNGYQQNSYQQNGYQPNFNQTPYYQQGPQKTPGYGSSIGSMVCGICSIVFCWCYGIVGLILGIVAIALSMRSKNLDGGVTNGMAKAGLVCGIIGTIFGVLYIIYLIFVVLIAGASAELYRLGM